MNYIDVRPLDESIFVDAMKKALSGNSDRLGCAVSFTGIVKRRTGDKVVEQLHLGLTQDLEDKLRMIAQDVSKRCSPINVVIYHNLDDIHARSFVTHIVVSAERRIEAFDAAREIIEKIKRNIHVDSVETYDNSRWEVTS
jgi:molybdopterin synthase catalytic subunit